MKKIIVMLVAVLVTSAVFAQVQTVTETFTDEQGNVYSNVVVGYVGTGQAVSVPSAGTTVVGTAAPTATPTQLGQIAVDATADAAYVAVGTTSSDWSLIPAGMSEGAFSVVGTTAPSATPTQLGQIAVDATADVAYIAVGTTSSDWNAIPQLVLNTTADVAATTITPVSAGAILYAANNVVVGASTGTLAIAVGTTTNDWKLLD